MSTITIGDLDKTIKVKEVLNITDEISGKVLTTVDELIEHWTDDEGLHHIPFFQDLEKLLDQRIQDAIDSSLGNLL